MKKVSKDVKKSKLTDRTYYILRVNHNSHKLQSLPFPERLNRSIDKAFKKILGDWAINDF
jgi:hypothetical protein